MTTAFEKVANAFATKLAAAVAVSANIVQDQEDDQSLPASYGNAIVVNLGQSDPQQLGGIVGHPVDWLTQIHVHCIASKSGSSARPAAGTLAGAAYARLAADPTLGLAGVYIGEPAINWEFDRGQQRYSSCTLLYTVSHRTTSLTLE